MKVGYICCDNPFENKKAWSGSIYKLREGIENAGYEVVWIPYKPKSFRIRLVCYIFRLLLHGKITAYNHNRLIYKLYASSINEKSEKFRECDYLFFPCGAQIALFLKTDKPIICYADATFKNMINYYWSNLHPWVAREGNKYEKKAIFRATINIRASKWAADSVINDYGFDAGRTFVLPLGPTLNSQDLIPVKPYQSGTLNVLFSGVEWERKGGDIAVKSVDRLNQLGIKAKLVIVGIRELPLEYKELPFIECVGFLDKNIENQYQQYIKTIKRCNILLLPTKAECAGIVFSEASAFGLPIFTYDTGGIGDYVFNGINGYRLPVGSNYVDFADCIKRVIDSGEMLKLHEGGIQVYSQKLAWNVWSDSFKKIIEKVI